ncbi:Uncharacterised protein [Vibrio cholerae]|nr:Uncharacterised protein [Vibrio cholerae]CSB82818.1 Uncharacterised protein [Vibrio cholerae]
MFRKLRIGLSSACCIARHAESASPQRVRRHYNAVSKFSIRPWSWKCAHWSSQEHYAAAFEFLHR